MTYSPKHWLWLNIDKEDSLGPFHQCTCPHLFKSDWNYCKMYKLTNVAEIRVYQTRVRSLEDGEIMETPISIKPTQSRQGKTGQNAKSSTQSSGKSADISAKPVQKDKEPVDDSNIATKIARQSESQVEVTETDSAGVDASIATPDIQISGTLNEWKVYIRHNTLDFGGSVGTDEVAKGVYGELQCRINILQSELKNATSNSQKSTDLFFTTLPKKYSLKDMPRFKLLPDGHKQPFTSLEHK